MDHSETTVPGKFSIVFPNIDSAGNASGPYDASALFAKPARPLSEGIAITVAKPRSAAEAEKQQQSYHVKAQHQFPTMAPRAAVTKSWFTASKQPQQQSQKVSAQ